MKYYSIFTLFGMILLLTTACGGGESVSSDPLDGTSWVLYAYRKTKPITGTTITLEFTERGFRGSAGCNSYSGGYQVRGDNITVSEIASTLMACMEPEGIMEQEQAYLSILRATQTHSITDNNLTIICGDNILIFEKE